MPQKYPNTHYWLPYSDLHICISAAKLLLTCKNLIMQKASTAHSKIVSNCKACCKYSKSSYACKLCCASWQIVFIAPWYAVAVINYVMHLICGIKKSPATPVQPRTPISDCTQYERHIPSFLFSWIRVRKQNVRTLQFVQFLQYAVKKCEIAKKSYLCIAQYSFIAKTPKINCISTAVFYEARCL